MKGRILSFVIYNRTMKALLVIEDGGRFATALGRALTFLGYNAVVRSYDDKEVQGYMESGAEADQVVITQTGFGEGPKLLERLRCDWRLPAMAIIFSVEAQERLQKEYPIMGKGVPGTILIKIPFYLRELEEVLTAAKNLSSEELVEIARKYCRLERSLRELLHNMINQAQTGKVNRELLQILKGRLELLSETFDAELKGLDEALLEAEIDSERLYKLLYKIQGKVLALEGKLLPKTKQPSLRFASSGPPKEYESILIVDDDGYDKATIERLLTKGYAVEVLESAKDAFGKLEYDPPDVLLCDWRLEGKPELGRQLVVRGRENKGVKLVILVSADVIDDAPVGVEVCVGQDKFNAELIHSLIWKRSETHVTS